MPLLRTKLRLVVQDEEGRPVSGASVDVRVRGTGAAAAVYQEEDPNSGVIVPGGNPLTTDQYGRVPGWLSRGPYYAVVSKSGLPSYTDYFESNPATDGGIDGAWIQTDAVGIRSIDDPAIPLGIVWQWWRPTSTFPVPAGSVFCDGRTLQASEHDFGTGGAITIPDLRNRFILGADAAEGDGVAAADGEARTDGPGIGGAGGRQLETAGFLLPGHRHVFMNPIAINSGKLLIVNPTDPQMDWAGSSVDRYDVGAGVTAIDMGGGGGAIGMERYGTTTSAQTAETRGTTDSHNNRPAYFGLLMMLKVRRA